MYSTKGTLKKNRDRWFINNFPIHWEHTLWLKMFGEEGMELNFYVETIADGTSEDDVIDMDIAKLTSVEGLVHKIYPQD